MKALETEPKDWATTNPALSAEEKNALSELYSRRIVEAATHLANAGSNEQMVNHFATLSNITVRMKELGIPFKAARIGTR